MSKPQPTNIAASVEARLKNIAIERKLDYRFILIRYAHERFLYRLSISPYAKKFVLKGGNLFVIWQKGRNFRPTVDSDMLCFGNAEPQHLREVFQSVCQLEGLPKDGMTFDPNSIEISSIREEAEYGGIRVVFRAHLARARVDLQFDIGTGDAITPAPKLTNFPVLLDGPIPRLKVYPMATAIAEKAQAMVLHGVNNSRMKDFYDIWLLAELFDHKYSTLRQAVCKTFERRNTAMPTLLPDCLSEEFMHLPIKQTQWNAFIRKNRLSEKPENFTLAVSRIRDFLMPVFFPPTEAPAKWVAAQGWK